jgi:RNA polymerase sigma-70 factor (ECF subfamily)
MPDSEARLIRLARRGDTGAFAALYDRHYGAVYRYCYYRVSDTVLAQDLASEVFVRMVAKLGTFKICGRPLLAWLYTIARNLIADMHRENGKLRELPLDAAEELASDGRQDLAQRVDQQLQADGLASALKHLTEEQRQVVLLKFVEDYSNAQVASVLDKSEGAVKALQHRALKALRRAIEAERRYEARC